MIVTPQCITDTEFQVLALAIGWWNAYGEFPIQFSIRYVGGDQIWTWYARSEEAKRHFLAAPSAVREVKKVIRTRVILQTFAYSRGAVPSADYVIDCRLIRNPYGKIPASLRKGATGRDPEVIAQVMRDGGAKLVAVELEKIMAMLGPPILQVAVGCSWGKHRSQVIANELHRELEKRGILVERLPK